MQYPQWKCITAFTTSPLVNKHAAWPCLTQQDSFLKIILLVLLKLNLRTHHSFPAERGPSQITSLTRRPFFSRTQVYLRLIPAVISSSILVHAISLRYLLPCGVSPCRLLCGSMWISQRPKWQENKHSHSFRPWPMPVISGRQADRAPGWSSLGDEEKVICVTL